MKTNREVVDILSQTSGSYINQLIWIAGSTDELVNEFLEDLHPPHQNKMFPEIKSPITAEKLASYKKLGFLAQVLIPKTSNFTFYKDDEPKSWSVNHGSLRVACLYAEDLDDLIKQVVAAADEVFKECMNKELNKDKTKKVQ